MYKQIITFDFSDDDTRVSFEGLLEKLGFEKAEDQSTYLLTIRSSLDITSIKQQIKQWSTEDDLYFQDDDFVQIYHAKCALNRVPFISTILMLYDVDNDCLLEQ